MKFIGLLCGTTAANNEEYRKVLKRRNIWIAAFALLGLMIAAAAFLAAGNERVQLPEYILGVYCGVGAGICLGCIFLIVRNLLIMGNEEKLKQGRLENSDERIAEIRNRACGVAIGVTLLLCMAAGLIFGIYEQVLIKAVLFVLDVFIFSYLIACAYYKNKI